MADDKNKSLDDELSQYEVKPKAAPADDLAQYEVKPKAAVSAFPDVSKTPKAPTGERPAYYGFTPSHMYEQAGQGLSEIGGGLKQVFTQNPMDTLEQQGAATAKEHEKAGELWKQPGVASKIQAAGHAVAGSIPFIGPWAAGLGEQASTGDVGGAIARGGTQYAVGELAPKAIKAVPEVVKPVVRATGRAMKNPVVARTIAPAITGAVGEAFGGHGAGAATAGAGLLFGEKMGVPEMIQRGGQRMAEVGLEPEAQLASRLVKVGDNLMTPQTAEAVKTGNVDINDLQDTEIAGHKMKYNPAPEGMKRAADKYHNEPMLKAFENEQTIKARGGAIPVIQAIEDAQRLTQKPEELPAVGAGQVWNETTGNWEAPAAGGVAPPIVTKPAENPVAPKITPADVETQAREALGVKPPPEPGKPIAQRPGRPELVSPELRQADDMVRRMDEAREAKPAGPELVKESAAVKGELGYNEAGKQITVVGQHGYMYRYGDVSPEQAAKYQGMESKGKAWNEIKKNHVNTEKSYDGGKTWIRVNPERSEGKTPDTHDFSLNAYMKATGSDIHEALKAAAQAKDAGHEVVS